MLRLEGDRDFRQVPGELFARLTDTRFLVGCIPDVETVRVAEPGRAELVLRPGLSFVRGTLQVTLQIAEATAPTSARMLISSRGIGTSSEVEAALALAPHEGGTRVHWTAEIKSLGGLLKMVPSGLIRGAAEKVLGDAWNSVEARLASEGTAAGGSTP
jgi:carbon monoxide dehydrogenase subunit G